VRAVDDFRRLTEAAQWVHSRVRPKPLSRLAHPYFFRSQQLAALNPSMKPLLKSLAL
jgi:hypothetical protein